MTTIILVPGFWLDASSWDDTRPALEAAGHEVRALTLPGLESTGADRRGITLADHVAAVVAAIDETEGPVVLVGHSAGASIVHAAADARPDGVARLVYVDSFPVPHGMPNNDELPAVDGEIALPDWSDFDEADLVDLDDELRTAFRTRAVPEPARVAQDPQVLTDGRRYDIPATVIACEFTSEQLQGWMAKGEAVLTELAAMRDVEYIELPTGHWPQLTRPADLGQAILHAVDR